MARRACPDCGAVLSEDLAGDRLSCPEHGRLRAWVVVDDGGALLGAGRAPRSNPYLEGACWLSPALPFLEVGLLDLTSR